METQPNEMPKIGETHELTFTVERNHCVEFSEKGIEPVLSTPSLIWFLEYAAHDLLDRYLSEYEFSVGTHVDIEHLGVTPLGKKVTCKAKLIHIDRKVLNFQVEAHDEQELVCKGVHKRRIVNAERFTSAIERKK